jgi:allantoinase
MILRSRRVVLPDGERPASILVEDGKIAAIAAYELGGGSDAGDAVIMPGVVDTHVHVNEPGRTEWEGFETATRAAAAGGTTTIVDMPLNSIPATTTTEALAAKRESARGHTWVDVGLWGGVVPGNVGELAPMVRAGALGFKCFLIESGVDEFPHVGEADLRPAMTALAPLGVPLLVHAEVAGPIDAAAVLLSAADPRRYATYLASRPAVAEDEAIALMVRLCREHRARTHIVHHSSMSALGALREARAAGLPLTAETCPHYLTFAAEEIADSATQFKCAPPIREARNREALWCALEEGVLDLIASDHSPCTPSLKAVDFATSWGGIAGLQLALSAVWTQARRRGRTLSDVVRWMCAGPARLAGLAGKKGAIAIGHDADLVVWRPEEEFTVTPERILHRHKVTPYLGARLFGVVEATYVRGERVDLGAGPRGQLLS